MKAGCTCFTSYYLSLFFTEGRSVYALRTVHHILVFVLQKQQSASFLLKAQVFIGTLRVSYSKEAFQSLFSLLFLFDHVVWANPCFFFCFF